MIKFENIKIAFEDQVVFDKFSLSIKKGEKILLSAPSGSGKSTLMKALLGFQHVDQGQISVGDRILSKETLHLIRSQVAYVSQDVELGQTTCQELLTTIFTFKRNQHLNVSKERYKELGEEFGLPGDYLSKNITQLSGGERQRLGFIICILLDRPIWILDEVTSGMDKQLKDHVVAYVLSSNQTVLITSHDEVWANQDAIKVVTW